MSGPARSATLWQACSPGSTIARRFNVPNYDGYRPFFLQGEAASAIAQKQSVELNEMQILKGILITLAEPEAGRGFGVTVNREVLVGLLDYLAKGFPFKNGEGAILNIAANVRESDGSQMSSRILRSGVQLLPRSSMIRSDLTTDLWTVAAEAQDANERQSTLLEIVETCAHIDLEAVHPQAAQAVAYMAYCAARLVRKEREAERFLEEYVYPFVSNRRLKQSILKVVESNGDVPMEELEFLD